MNQNRNQRAKSYFSNMRTFHNSIKRDMYNKYTNNINNLLDLACGKGGDLDKWVSNNINNVVGYDIDSESIKEAKKRVINYNNKKNTNVSVYVKDLSINVIQGNKNFDVISSMFAFHYFFKSKDTFRTIMDTINNNLKDDGIFMGTMFDGNKMRELLNNRSFELVDNSNELRFKVDLIEEIKDNFFGNKIKVFLKDTVLDEPMDEYLVYFNKFVDIMKSENFELIESKMFSDLITDNFKLNNIEKSISFLNRTFVFKKKQDKKPECKNITDYLIECNWERDINDIILEKYKEGLRNNISKTTLETKKKQYQFIIDNFLNMKMDDLSIHLQDYFTVIYNMYLSDISKYKTEDI